MPRKSEESDRVWQIETNLDNATGEQIGFLFERLFEAGALDVFASPVIMKKSRPAWTLSALAAPDRVDEVERLMLLESPTFGVRRWEVERRKLARSWETVKTKYGPIRVKVGRFGGKVVRRAPEFEDLRAAAIKHRVPLSTVLAAIRPL